MATWVLTGGIENFRINAERGFDVIGFKERRRNQALEFEPGDEIVFYVTKYAGEDRESAGQAFGAIARVTSGMFENRTPIWPQGKKKYPEEYPWRVEAEPVLVLEEPEFVRVESLLDELEHVRRWPAEHWHLAFQGQLRTISDADAALVRERMQAAAGAPATAG
jgi:predicted RNA-binding protein